MTPFRGQDGTPELFSRDTPWKQEVSPKIAVPCEVFQRNAATEPSFQKGKILEPGLFIFYSTFIPNISFSSLGFATNCKRYRRSSGRSSENKKKRQESKMRQRKQTSTKTGLRPRYRVKRRKWDDRQTQRRGEAPAVLIPRDDADHPYGQTCLEMHETHERKGARIPLADNPQRPAKRNRTLRIAGRYEITRARRGPRTERALTVKARFSTVRVAR